MVVKMAEEDSVPIQKDGIWVLEDREADTFVYDEILGSEFKLSFFSSTSALREAFENAIVLPPLLIADIRLEGESFIDFLKTPAKKYLKMINVIVVSGVTSEEALNYCLDAGAVDYLVKPFNESELLVKVKRTIKKSLSPVHLDYDQHIVQNHQGKVFNLTPKEFRIFNLLNQSFGSPISKEQIIESVWPSTRVGTRTLDVHITNLRRKIAQLGLQIVWTVPNLYTLEICREDG